MNFFILILFIILNSGRMAFCDPGYNKIIGGDDTLAPDFFVSLVSKKNDRFRVSCGGSLIYNQGQYVVVTAAHCIGARNDDLYVAIKPNRVSEINEQSLIRVKIIFLHPGYNVVGYSYDLALLILDETNPILQDRTFRPIPLHLDSVSVPDRDLTVIGFGKISSYGLLKLDALQSIALKEISNRECKKLYENRSYEEISPSNICAGKNLETGQYSACQGDSGGPLVAKTKNGLQLIGIASWAIGCAQANSPGVYIRPAAFADWIKGRINFVNGSTEESTNLEYLASSYCYHQKRILEMISEDNQYFKLHLGPHGKFEHSEIPGENITLVNNCPFFLPNGNKLERSIYLLKNYNTYNIYSIIRSDNNQIVWTGQTKTNSASYKIQCNKGGNDLSVRISKYGMLKTANVNFNNYRLNGRTVLTPQEVPLDDFIPKIYCGSDDIYVTLFFNPKNDQKILGFFDNKIEKKHSYWPLAVYPNPDPNDVSINTELTLNVQIQGRQNGYFLGTLKIINNCRGTPPGDVHSWQLSCENLKFHILEKGRPFLGLDNISPIYKVNRHPLATIKKGASITVQFITNKDLSRLELNELNQLKCKINQMIVSFVKI